LDVLLVALPLVAYFIIMFFISFDKSKGFGYAKCSAMSFSACGNNFELSLVAIASFGFDSGQAFASIVGVLIEVPIMITLASWLKRNKWAST
ncbi:MAG: arsenical-resistance protein, partial [Helicobacter sp.]|nr:arsenical-resistance protein [Helicobacter sp.]